MLIRMNGDKTSTQKFIEEVHVKTIIGFIAFIIIVAIANADEGGVITSLERPADVSAKFEESYFKTQSWMNEFRYIVVVNKANEGKDAQTIKVYEYGQVVRKELVSTGRDQFEKKGEHHSKKDSWSVTPTGYYTPDWLDKDHRSSNYGGIFSKIIGGTKMPFAIFFNGPIALHQAPKGTEGALGTKASGGCIRLPESLAEDLFNRINETIGARVPKFTVEGNPVLDSAGHLLYRSEPGFSALIIVINKIVQ